MCNALDIDPGEDLINSNIAARINGYIGGYGAPSRFDKEWPSWGIKQPLSNYIRKQLINQSRGAC